MISSFHPMAFAVAPPPRFTYPFLYRPHPLCLAAAELVRAYIATVAEIAEDAARGKMFGVLIVEGGGRTGFLAAYSGLLAGRNDWAWFVPPVFDAQRPDGHFKTEERAIGDIGTAIAQCPPEDKEAADALRAERRQRSEALQAWLFGQYSMLNANGRAATLPDIFRRHQATLPPAGAGDCCAPKLLQVAYKAGLRPLCMGEWWEGASPRGELRRQGQWYAACRSKCLPILGWMMQGLDVDPNPHEQGETRVPEVVYEDKDIMVVVKPEGMLSVPGNIGRRSLLDILREMRPEADCPMIVHRLDMATSGLMVVAKTMDAYHNLQRQFTAHTIEKHYTALLEGDVRGDSGVIDLPLRPDIDDRPRQMVDAVYGKRAVSKWRVIGREEGRTLVEFQPITGRTHQLRVHAAHPDGLGCPIVGDELYGTPGERLCLHASLLAFAHPATGRRTEFANNIFPAPAP